MKAYDNKTALFKIPIMDPLVILIVQIVYYINHFCRTNTC